MRLVGMMLHAPLNTPGLRLPTSGLVEPGKGNLEGWRLHVRGPRVILASPPGWIPGEPAVNWKGTDRVMFDIPRECVTLMWSGVESELDGLSKYSPADARKVRSSPPQDSVVEDADPTDESTPPAPAAVRSTKR